MAITRPATRTNQAAPQQAPTGNLPARQQQRGAPAQQEPKGPPPIVQFRDYVQARMTTLEEALPLTIPPKRFVSVLMTALQNKPKLLECTFPSLWNACVRAAQDGLLPDGREGAIAPYGENKDGKRIAEIATWMPMVEGYRKKIFETGKVDMWTVQVVREKDEFEYELGDNAFIKHKPFVGMTSPGNIVGAYSIAKLSSGEKVYEVMGAFEIMQIASKSKAGNGPWKDPVFVPEMAKKVVARRHYKQLPHSESMDAMIARDDATHGLIDDQTPRIAPPTTRRLSHGEAFDAYAGATIEHDEDDVIRGDGQDGISDQDRSDFEQEASSTAQSPPAGRASKGADTASQARASAPTTNADAAGAGSPGATPAAEAGAQGTSAPASSTSQTPEEITRNDGTGEGEPDDQIIEEDGADRPWPPGAVPNSEAEYGRYLRTKLSAFTVGADVPRWWNSAEEKELRSKCGVAANFKAYQDLAIARRTALGSGQK